MVFSLVIACLAWMPSEDPQAAPRSVGAQSRPPDEIASKLGKEVARLETCFVSEFFAALSKSEGAGDPAGISREQAAVIRGLDEVARDALRSWSARGLEKGGTPASPEQFERMKQSVVAHAEAVVLEAVLTADQAKHWRGRISRPGIPPLTGRYPTIPYNYNDERPLQTLGDFDATIRSKATYLSWEHGSASDLFAILLGVGTEPIAGLSAPQADLKANKGPIPGLSSRELKLLQRLERVACDAQRLWLLRCLDKVPPQGDLRQQLPTRAMEQRLSDSGKRLCASIVAHAEAIALEAVLNPDQAETAKRRLWIRTGLYALLDPDLGRLLRITSAQREEIATRLEARTVLFHNRQGVLGNDFAKLSQASLAGQITEAQWKASEKQLVERFDDQMGEYDEPIWEVLSTAQIRVLNGILGRPAPSRPPAKPKRAGRPG
jgi:hypothetical protein